MPHKFFTHVLLCAVGLQWVMSAAAQTGDAPTTQNTHSTPWNQIGARAGADYQGDGLSVAATEAGARLHCLFQRMDGEATGEGLWLVSTATNQPGDRFRVVARAVGGQALAAQGTVTVTGETVRFTRAGLVEEYSVSMDGVRQDFVVTEKPAGNGQLKVLLAVSGARVEPAAYGAELVLEKSGRKIAYSRVHVTDAKGRELPARIEAGAEMTLTVVVNDAGAVYPVRIDPTFSDANWISMGGLDGANGNVYAAVMDGSGNLYIGGGFSSVGNVMANNIVQWNGSSWMALGSGMNSQVNALAVSGGTLYAGGNFTNAGGNAANYIAQWNGSSWSALGSGMNSNVCAISVSGGMLYAGGNFTNAGGNAANYIAQWNGSSWSALGSGMNSNVCAVSLSGGTLYVGGDFTSAGGNAADYIARWNGSSWSALGSGMNSQVNALAVSGTNLYAGGGFTRAGGNAANYIAQWNGSGWSALGSGMNSNVAALAVSGGTLYAGGGFTSAGGKAATNIAQWNGSSWSVMGLGMSWTVMGTPMNGYVYALAVSGGTVYAGGYFTTAGGNLANCIAQWNGSNWLALGSGIFGGDINGPLVRSLAVSGSTLYVGGDFTLAGGKAAANIAQWNGSNWSALGSGVNGEVYALAVLGTNLYAGGQFTTAGGKAAANIAQWNGSSWSALGSGMNDAVLALTVSGNTLYVGGCFTNAGGKAANYIAQWNGSGWSALGSGMNNDVNALAISGSELYAGGDFTTAGGNSANYIARWYANSWSELELGVSDGVTSLAVSGGTLYVGGSFMYAGGNTAYYIAQWNSSGWSALGSGMDSDVNSLAVSGGTLYAGGFFESAGGNTAFFIAQWNGSNWSPLGSGMRVDLYLPDVRALAVSGGTLYAGGEFTTAGGNVSYYTAEATIAPPTILSQPQSTNVMAGSNANFAVGAIGQPLSYQWFKNGNGMLDGGNVCGSASNLLLLTNVYMNDPGTYQVLVTNNFGSVTSSVATLTVSDLPLMLACGQGNSGCTSNRFWLTLAGPAGSNVVVYGSMNLQSWAPLATNPLNFGSLIFTDVLASNYLDRFYRVQLSP